MGFNSAALRKETVASHAHAPTRHIQQQCNRHSAIDIWHAKLWCWRRQERKIELIGMRQQNNSTKPWQTQTNRQTQCVFSVHKISDIDWATAQSAHLPANFFLAPLPSSNSIDIGWIRRKYTKNGIYIGYCPMSLPEATEQCSRWITLRLWS